MKWANGTGRVPPIKNILDKYQILNRLLQTNQALLASYGTPVSYWRNEAITEIGTLPKENIHCYCWPNSQAAQSRKDHALCTGTGILSVYENGNDIGGGYQKYGFREHLVSIPSRNTLSSKNIVASSDNSRYSISGTSTSENIVTERFKLDNYLSLDHFLVNDEHDNANNKIEYYYSLDDTIWIPITIISTSHTKIATGEGNFNITTLTPYIRFKIVIRKKTATVSSSVWNSIRFRYRKMKTLIEIDPRFDIHIPSFLAIRQQTKTIIEGSEQGGGWVTRWPLSWKIGPEAKLNNSDVIRFLMGEYKDYMFVAKDITKNSYGMNQQILSRSFESEFLRDENDIMKVVHLLI